MTQVIDFIGGEYRNRTGLHGFAIRCITYLPTRRLSVVVYQGLAGCKIANHHKVALLIS